MTSWFILFFLQCAVSEGKLCNQAACLEQQITARPVGHGSSHACVGATRTSQPRRRMRHWVMHVHILSPVIPETRALLILSRKVWSRCLPLCI